jgi:hypothetical protein
MSNKSAVENVKRHRHGNFEKQSTDHVRNVDLVRTHYLMECDNCGWRGWVIKQLIDKP